MEKISSNTVAIVQSQGSSNRAIYSAGYGLLNNIHQNGVLLDFGAGQGNFLLNLGQHNFQQLIAADIMYSPSNAAKINQWITTDLNQKLPLTDHSCDVIISLEVIEHLENPRATAREWKRLLKKNGTIIFSTPNNESIRSLLSIILRGHFISFLDKDYPAHITALTRLDMTRILNETGFSQIQFSYSNQGLIPSLGGITWQQLSLGLLKGRLFSDNIFVTAKSSP